MTSEEALRNEWFREAPLSKSKEFIPTYLARHDHDRYDALIANGCVIC